MCDCHSSDLFYTFILVETSQLVIQSQKNKGYKKRMFPYDSKNMSLVNMTTKTYDSMLLITYSVAFKHTQQ